MICFYFLVAWYSLVRCVAAAMAVKFVHSFQSYLLEADVLLIRCQCSTLDTQTSIDAVDDYMKMMLSLHTVLHGVTITLSGVRIASLWSL